MGNFSEHLYGIVFCCYRAFQRMIVFRKEAAHTDFVEIVHCVVDQVVVDGILGENQIHLRHAQIYSSDAAISLYSVAHGTFGNPKHTFQASYYHLRGRLPAPHPHHGVIGGEPIFLNVFLFITFIVARCEPREKLNIGIGEIVLGECQLGRLECFYQNSRTARCLGAVVGIV